jgi:hypothetical protein
MFIKLKAVGDNPCRFIALQYRGTVPRRFNALQRFFYHMLIVCYG